MRLIQPLPGGTVEGARAHLVNAQGAAANVSNNPYVDTLKNLNAGIRSAKRAASELFLAPPRSEFQDLVSARRQVLEGVLLLEHAVSAYGSAHGVDNMPLVKDFAGQAFNAFEGAFEILDND